ncbi:hypothetical protein ACHAWU_001240 [Discostella pseudostelligera]|uniref:Uncharacterized protein n=1 Tax=Discostella pseudostelligera TaxID=259834 RepID=A0ABD3N0H4_9STRA
MSNPFMVTSNECYGMSLREASKRVYASPVSSVEAASVAASGRDAFSEPTGEKLPSNNHDVSFLYSRESDRYGDGCQFSDSVLSHVFRLKESDTMNKRRKSSIVLQQSQNADVPASSKTYSKEEVSEILSQYNHSPKKQHPLYGTTANEYGLKKPSQATFQNVRNGVSQKFSKSFNRILFRDEGLNTSIPKSRIHDSLIS